MAQEVFPGKMYPSSMNGAKSEIAQGWEKDFIWENGPIYWIIVQKRKEC